MRDVNFTTTEVDAAEGQLILRTRKSHAASIVDFFFGHVGQYLFGVFPPLEYLNDFMRLGSIDGEFEGRHVLFEWQPCELSDSEYDQVAQAVRQLPGQPFEVVEVPDTVKTKAEFEHWAFVRALERQQSGFQP
jgi:hypothetical protein